MSFLIALNESAPKEFLVFVEGYLETHKELNLLWCSHVVTEFPFVVAELTKRGTDAHWTVHIRTDYVLAIANTTGTRAPFGFLSGLQ
jgi:hypothetical protein